MEKISKSVYSNDFCCGCSVCLMSCPQNAISMKKDDKGFYHAIVSTETCINCGKCQKVCIYSSSRDFETLDTIKVYGIKHIDPEVRSNSRSGGAFTLVSDAILEKGGIVYGVIQENISSVRYIRATNKNDRDKMRGSKYVQCILDDKMRKQIRDDVESGRQVLFVGSACQCQGLRLLYPRQKYANLILLDFICHGVGSPQILKDELDFYSSMLVGPVVAYDFRDKQKFTWDKHVERIETSSNVLYTQRFRELFCTNHILRKSCFDCLFTTPKRCSDFTIGDFWGIEKISPNFNDNRGVSVVLIRSEIANQIILEQSNNCEMITASVDSLIHYNLKRPTKQPKDYDSFWIDYYENGFEYVSKKYGNYSFLRRLKRKLFNNID